MSFFNKIGKHENKEDKIDEVTKIKLKMNDLKTIKEILVNQFFQGKKVTKYTEIDINKLLESMEDDPALNNTDQDMSTTNFIKIRNKIS